MNFYEPSVRKSQLTRVINSPYAMVVPPFQMSCPSGEAMPGAKIKAYETRELLGRWEAQGYRDTCIPTGYPRVKIHGHCVYVYMRGSCDIIPLPWCNNVQLRGAPPKISKLLRLVVKMGSEIFHSFPKWTWKTAILGNDQTFWKHIGA